MAAAERSSSLCVAAGTAGGQVEFLDVATAALTASMLAAPGEVGRCFALLRRHLSLLAKLPQMSSV